MIYLVVPHTLFVIAALTIGYMPLTNTIVYSTFPYIYMAIGYSIDKLQLKRFVLNFIDKAGTATGKYSYPLYISHYTVLFVFSRLIHHVLLYAIVSLPIIAVIAYGLENWFQPVVMRYFKRRKQQTISARAADLPMPVFEEAQLHAETV